MRPHLVSCLLPLLASQLWLVEGLRDRHRARIGIRRHRHYDDKHGDDLDHIKAAVDIFDDQEAFDDSAELLQGAENGRYKVIAKAEPYKNLPPAPVTPEDEYFPVTPAPGLSHVTSSHRKYEPTTPAPDEELKFALLNDAKTQKYVPVRQTPAYQATTPRYSVTPPAIEFEPTPAESKGKKSKSQSKPQHGRFKISVDNEDVNNFQPTPPPTTPPPPPPPKQHHKHQNKKKPKRPKPTPAKNLYSPTQSHKSNKSSVKNKKKNSSAYFVSQDEDREDDLITNEIESGSLEKNKVQIVSTSIYDPRPKSRSYKKNYNAHKRERNRIPKKYNYRSQHNTKNYNLPIREHHGHSSNSKKQSPSKSKKKVGSKAFNPVVDGYKTDQRQFETVKREHSPAAKLLPVPDPVKPKPIFLAAHHAPAPAHVKSLLPLSKPTFKPPPPPVHASPFTAFTASPTPALLPRLPATPAPVIVKETPPPPSPTPPLAQFSKPVQHFASFAPVDSVSFHPKSHHPAPIVHRPPPPPAVPHPPPPPAPVVHHPPPPAPFHPPTPHPVEHIDPHLEELENYEPKPYSYNFGVNDAYSGVDYNRAEERSDTGVTRGSYTVKLPDGRVQTVSYVADDNGFHATVTYEGEPAYPEVQDVAVVSPHHDVPHQEVLPREPLFKPNNRYRASNRVAHSEDLIQFISPTPNPVPHHAAVHHTTPAPHHTVHHTTPVPHHAVHHTTPVPHHAAVHHSTIAPVVQPVIGPIVKEAPPLIGPVVKSLPTPAPTITPTTTSYTPYTASPFPNFSPSPTPFFHSPSPSPYYGSPSPLPIHETSTPAPAPIFHTTPSLLLGLKGSHHPDPLLFNVGASSFNVPQQVPFSNVAKRHDDGYHDITTWRPRYPKILEHTLRSAPSETYYGHRIKKGVKDEDEVTVNDEYDE